MVSDTIGPIDRTSTSYLVNVPSGQKIRFNVRDSANSAYEGSAFTDAIDIGKHKHAAPDVRMSS